MNPEIQQNCLEKQTKDSESLVSEKLKDMVVSRVVRDTGNLV